MKPFVTLLGLAVFAFAMAADYLPGPLSLAANLAFLAVLAALQVAFVSVTVVRPLWHYAHGTTGGRTAEQLRISLCLGLLVELGLFIPMLCGNATLVLPVEGQQLAVALTWKWPMLVAHLIAFPGVLTLLDIQEVPPELHHVLQRLHLAH